MRSAVPSVVHTTDVVVVSCAVASLTFQIQFLTNFAGPVLLLIKIWIQQIKYSLIVSQFLQQTGYCVCQL